MTRTLLILVVALLAACTSGTRRALPVLALLFSAHANAATFDASWNVLSNDSAAYDYVLVVDSQNPPVREQFRGRTEVVNGRMLHTFDFVSTGLPDTVTQLCAAVRAEHRATQRTNALSTVVCMNVDLATPDIVTGFTFTAR